MPDLPRKKNRFGGLCGCSLMTVGIALLAVILVWRYALPSVWSEFMGPPYGSDGPHSGWTAVWLGDVDGDAVLDIALRTPFEPTPGHGWGATRILSGARGDEIVVLHGLNINELMAEQIGPIGDLDGDGKGDTWCKPGYYAIQLLSGTDAAHAKTLRVNLGSAVAAMGDVDQDGLPDLLISGFPRTDDAIDTISAVSSRTSHAIWTLTRHEASPSSSPFAWNACMIGDVNADGFADAGIVDEREQIQLVDGRSGELIRELPHRVDWGTGLMAPLGDIDGDKVPEIAVYEGWQTFEQFEARESGVNSLLVISCATGAVLKKITVPEYLRSAFSPGDVDGDGMDDLAWLGGGELKVARVSDGRELHSIKGVWSNPGIGDFDKDGCADLLITRNIRLDEGASAPPDLWRKGRVEVISGKDGSILRTLDERVLPAANE